jgi:hypothetical protein
MSPIQSIPRVVPAVSSDSTDILKPGCPVLGKTYRTGKASDIFSYNTATLGIPLNLAWSVTFAGQRQIKAPVNFVPHLFTCGLEHGMKPFGHVKAFGKPMVTGTCSNGSCTVTTVIDVSVTTAGLTLPGGRPWKYDLILFTPEHPKPGYGTLAGIRVAVKQ